MVHETDKDGMTPLHWAADRGFCDVVSTLIAYNASVNVKDSEGQTPLHYANIFLIICFPVLHDYTVSKHFQLSSLVSL
ncbi:unnamed protein product [Heterobilharzia americana]|nr:unnamed protein product [Heterobilharzia americana]